MQKSNRALCVYFISALAVFSANAYADDENQRGRSAIVGTYISTGEILEIENESGTFSCQLLIDVGAIETCTGDIGIQFEQDGTYRQIGFPVENGYQSEAYGN